MAKKIFGVIIGLWSMVAFVVLCWFLVGNGPEMKQVPVLFFTLTVFSLAVRLMFGRKAMWTTVTWEGGLTAFYSGILFVFLQMSDAGARIRPDGFPLESTSTYVVLGVLVVVGLVVALVANEKGKEGDGNSDNYERLFGRPTPDQGSRLLK